MAATVKKHNKQDKANTWKLLARSRMDKQLLSKLRYIRSCVDDGSMTNKEASSEEGRTCRLLMDALRIRMDVVEWDGDPKEPKPITTETFNRYVTSFRSVIKESGLLHHNKKAIIENMDEKMTTVHFKELLGTIDLSSFKALRWWGDQTVDTIKAAAKADSSLRNDAKKAIAWINGKKKTKGIIDRLYPHALTVLTRTVDEKTEVRRLNKQVTNSYGTGERAIYFDPKIVCDEVARLMNLPIDATAFIPVNSAQDQVRYQYKNGSLGIILGLMLATGRRMYEIVYLTNFRAISKTQIEISNLAKQPIRDKETVYTIDTFFNAREIVKVWNYLRSSESIKSLKEELDAKETSYHRVETFNSRWSPRLNEAARSIFTDGITDKKGGAAEIKAKDLRDLYVMILYDLALIENPTLDKHDFITAHLIHVESDTARNYKKYHNAAPLSENDKAKTPATWKYKQTKPAKDTRAAELKLLLTHTDIAKHKVFTSMLKDIIQRIKSDPSFVLSSYSLRNFHGKDQKIKGLAAPSTIRKLMKIIDDQKINRAA